MPLLVAITPLVRPTLKGKGMNGKSETVIPIPEVVLDMEGYREDLSYAVEHLEHGNVDAAIALVRWVDSAIQDSINALEGKDNA